MIEVLPDPAALAKRTADVLAEEIGKAIAARMRCTLGLSGGTTPKATFNELAKRAVDWSAVEIFQIDERVAPDGHPDRNIGLIERELLAHIEGSTPVVHPMRVVTHDLDAAAGDYARSLEETAGTPPSLDVVQLGLGPDGHTASLFDGDPASLATERWVAVTGARKGYVRMTVTFPVLNASKVTVFLVQGPEAADAVAMAGARDPSIPAGRLQARDVRWLLDLAAAADLPSDLR